MHKILPESLKKAIEDYETMQEEHLHEYDENPDPDYIKRNFERSKAFEELKNQVSANFNDLKDGKDSEKKKMFMEIMTKLVEQNKVLLKRAVQYRIVMEQKIKHLGHGKRALKGYGQPGQSNTTKFVGQTG